MMYSRTAAIQRPGRRVVGGRAYHWDTIRGVWRSSAGMGMYPTDACYDPGRPSWLPYWWDTPSESGCRYGVYPDVTTLGPVPAPPGGQPMGAPQTLNQMTTPGAFTPDQAIQAGADATKAVNQKFFNDLASQQAFGAPPPPPPFGLPTWVWIALAAGGGFLLLRR